MTQKFVIGAAALAVTAFTLSAQAQTRTSKVAATAPAAAARPPLNHGPPLAGVCIFFERNAVGSSLAGAAASARIQQLESTVKAEIEPQQTSLQTDVAAFQKARATLSADAVQKQEAALQQRYATLERLANQRQQELQATQARALQRIRVELDPLIGAVYQAQHCSMLLNGDGAVLTANPAMDVTAQVVTQLNAKLPTITFDREHLDQSGPTAR